MSSSPRRIVHGLGSGAASPLVRSQDTLATSVPAREPEVIDIRALIDSSSDEESDDNDGDVQHATFESSEVSPTETTVAAASSRSAQVRSEA